MQMAVNGGSQLLIFVPSAAHKHDLPLLRRAASTLKRIAALRSNRALDYIHCPDARPAASRRGDPRRSNRPAHHRAHPGRRGGKCRGEPRPGLQGGPLQDNQEFAKDVAAFANHVGGLIVIGVRERQLRAAELTPVTLAKDPASRYEQVLLRRTTPFVRDVDIRVLSSTDQPGRGIVLIAVFRSPLAPHALFNEHDDLRRMYWPVRSGTGTRYMDETELADFYRTRFAGAAAQIRATGQGAGRRSTATRRSASVARDLAGSSAPGRSPVHRSRGKGPPSDPAVGTSTALARASYPRQARPAAIRHDRCSPSDPAAWAGLAIGPAAFGAAR